MPVLSTSGDIDPMGLAVMVPPSRLVGTTGDKTELKEDSDDVSVIAEVPLSLSVAVSVL